MKHIAAKLCLVLLLGATTPTFAHELVLIVSAKSAIEQLQSPVIRKLFLGLTVTQHGSRLRPVLNETEAQIKELFLQNIVAMSDSTYDRYILRMALLEGTSQPAVYRTSAQLISAVASDPALVGYAWASDVEHDPRVRRLRVIWHD